MEERLSRHFKAGAKSASRQLQPLFAKLWEKVKGWYLRILELEEWYRHKALKASFKDKVGREQYTGNLLNRAEQETAEEKRKAKKSRAALYETPGGVVGAELAPDQVGKRDTLMGN